MLSFRITHQDGAARLGMLDLPHGRVETPQFMPVGTAGSVKAIAPDDLSSIGVQILLGNTYHLLLRPGPELVAEMGGLHRFMSWQGPILTDSGGFQVFSLAQLRTVTLLSGGVAHEINNPLGVVMGQLELLEMGVPPEGREARRIHQALEAAREIKQIVGRMARITRVETTAWGTDLPPILDIRRSSEAS